MITSTQVAVLSAAVAKLRAALDDAKRQQDCTAERKQRVAFLTTSADTVCMGREHVLARVAVLQAKARDVETDQDVRNDCMENVELLQEVLRGWEA